MSNHNVDFLDFIQTIEDTAKAAPAVISPQGAAALLTEAVYRDSIPPLMRTYEADAAKVRTRHHMTSDMLIRNASSLHPQDHVLRQIAMPAVGDSIGAAANIQTAQQNIPFVEDMVPTAKERSDQVRAENLKVTEIARGHSKTILSSASHNRMIIDQRNEMVAAVATAARAIQQSIPFIDIVDSVAGPGAPGSMAAQTSSAPRFITRYSPATEHKGMKGTLTLGRPLEQLSPAPHRVEAASQGIPLKELSAATAPPRLRGMIPLQDSPVFVDIVSSSTDPPIEPRPAGGATVSPLSLAGVVSPPPADLSFIDTVPLATHSHAAGDGRSLRMSTAEKMAVAMASKKRQADPGSSLSEAIEGSRTTKPDPPSRVKPKQEETIDIEDPVVGEEEKVGENQWNEDATETPGTPLLYRSLMYRFHISVFVLRVSEVQAQGAEIDKSDNTTAPTLSPTVSPVAPSGPAAAEDAEALGDEGEEVEQEVDAAGREEGVESAAGSPSLDDNDGDTGADMTSYGAGRTCGEFI